MFSNCAHICPDTKSAIKYQRFSIWAQTFLITFFRDEMFGAAIRIHFKALYICLRTIDLCLFLGILGETSEMVFK